MLLASFKMAVFSLIGFILRHHTTLLGIFKIKICKYEFIYLHVGQILENVENFNQSLLLQFFNLRPFNPLKVLKTGKKILKMRILKKIDNEKFLLLKTGT